MSQSYLLVKSVVSLLSRQDVSRFRRLRRPGMVWMAVVAMCALTQPRAATIPFPDENVSYQLQGDSLQSFLRRFFDDVGVAATLSDAVREEAGTLNGPRSGKPASVFKSIADSNGLVAYYDGSVVFVYKSREVSERYFQVDPERMEAFREATIGFGLPDANDSLKIKPGSSLITARGTPRFLDQLTQLASALTPRPRASSSQPRTTLHFISLKYAWAADTTFTTGDQKTNIPGVATILRQLLGQDNGRPAAAANSGFGAGLRGKGLAAYSDRLARSGSSAGPPGAAYGSAPASGMQSEQPEGAEEPPRATLGSVTVSADAPRIVADPYRNAVIIRDAPARMAIYDDLVHKLDVESQIIELDATVIDIESSKVQQLGIDWTYQHGQTGATFGGGVSPVDSSGNLAGLQINSIISNASAFTARVNALQLDGVTNIVQRPQVVTLNDAEAVIESTQSVYIPVSGAYDEDLFNVQAGTILHVTPHIIDDLGRRRIRLLVSIQDGTVTVSAQPTTMANGQTLSQPVPTVANNAVNTQAIVELGQGLLLGGLVRREHDHTTQKVPVLGSIPLLGRLFRSDTVNHTDTERLFLISPQIIVASAAAGGGALPKP